MTFETVAKVMAVGGGLVFVGIVGILHTVQSDYDPVHQLMSELALGPHGWAMLPAFASLAAASAGCAVAVRGMGSSLIMQLLLLVSGAAFMGAGLFPLGPMSELHIGFVAVAFVSLALVMYLLPGATLGEGRLPRLPSWLLGSGLALSVFLGESLLPMGVAQRLAAGFLVLWFVWVGLACRVTPN